MACENDFNLMKMPQVHKNVVLPGLELPQTFKEAAQEFKVNCEFTTKNFDKYPSIELCIMEVRNNALLGLMSDMAIWH